MPTASDPMPWPCTSPGERPGLASAGLLQPAPIRRTDDLVLEPLEEKLAAAAGAKRLVAVVPEGLLAPGYGRVGRTELVDRGPAPARGDEHLAEAVPAEVAVELRAKHHHRDSSTSRTAETDPLFQYRPEAVPVFASVNTQPRHG